MDPKMPNAFFVEIFIALTSYLANSLFNLMFLL
jgi:hypothetical protein